ncbi:MAG: hypothetical protein JRD93_10590 [Deltaproteobacteria bacterium]|nr:hypothetical protein [Deltaproteobacteria bacterium]
MKNRKPELNREENHLVKATLLVKDTEINGVPCKIYLPERTHEKPYVVFKPSQEDAHKIMGSHKGTLKATIYGFDKEIQTTIEAPEVYFSGGSTKHWGDDISETTIPGEPQDLHVIHHLKNHECQGRTHIVFWISPNKFLTPSMICSNSYTGEIKYERVRNLEFGIKDGIQIVFEKHFSSKTGQNGDLIQWSFLVACADLKVSADDVETLKTNMLPDIDDFLLIASFAARERTGCLGWTATDKNSDSTFYRGKYTFPKGNDDSSMDYGVIDIQHFERFMQTCYSAFLRFENSLAIRNALYSSVPSTPQTLETSFLRTFSGLETLVLDFRRRENLEFTLPEDEWPALRKYLQKCIKESTKPKLERKQRTSIYCKLGELNRVSLGEAFDVFCQKYAIDLKDLWPVFGNKEIVGLSDIRNRLIHGDPFPDDLFGTLVVAKEHLKYTLERVIARVLGWDIGKTKVSPAYLRNHFTVMKDLPSEQTRLSEYIHN